MAIDHITVAFLSNEGNTWYYLLGRCIGRIAFPLFCFLLVEGFYKTGNIKKYAIRLAACAVISELPFDCFNGLFITNTPFAKQNVVFTLLIGLFMMMGVDYLRKMYYASGWAYNIGSVLIIVTAGVLATVCHTDYEFVGIVYIIVFYFLRFKSRWVEGIFFSAVVVCAYAGTSSIDWVNYFAVLALIPVFMYRGEQGRPIRARFLFYAIYPLHLLVLGFLRFGFNAFNIF